jgi:acetyltransferase
MNYSVLLIDASGIQARMRALSSLLQDAVAHGASVGFLQPLSEDKASAYWRGVLAQVELGSKKLWVLMQGEKLLGSVQLELCQRENGRQRAEVQKLFVHSSVRRAGLARLLMLALEEFASAHALRTLVLDTEAGSGAEHLYQRLAYQRVGEIPDYAHSAAGQACATAIYFKNLSLINPKDAA